MVNVIQEIVITKGKVIGISFAGKRIVFRDFTTAFAVMRGDYLKKPQGENKMPEIIFQGYRHNPPPSDIGLGLGRIIQLTKATINLIGIENEHGYVYIRTMDGHEAIWKGVQMIFQRYNGISKIWVEGTGWVNGTLNFVFDTIDNKAIQKNVA